MCFLNIYSVEILRDKDCACFNEDKILICFYGIF